MKLLIIAKQISTENMYEGTGQKYLSCQWTRRFNHHGEVGHTVSGCAAICK
jgi:hypothetical protein